MTRIRGWIKLSEEPSKIVWKNMASGHFLTVELQSWGKWSITWDNGIYNIRDVSVLDFKRTKREALKYARDWMKKHPKGWVGR